MRFPALALALLSLLLSTAGAKNGDPDSFGYTFTDSTEPGGPHFEWIDISTSGGKILANPLGGSALPTEVAQIDLSPKNLFYGISSTFLRVSRHGYTSNTGGDPGDDFTNDCPITTVPSSGGGSRHAVFHDRISGVPGTWGVYHQFFPQSPHPHFSGFVHIIQWDKVKLFNDPSAAAFSFQALLFANGDVLYQYKDTPPGSATASVGTVWSAGPTRDGLEYSCNSPADISASLAVLFEPPTIIVDTETDETDGIDVGNISLRDAVEAANSGWKIKIAPGLEEIVVYNEVQYSNGALFFDKNLIIEGQRSDPRVKIALTAFDVRQFSGEHILIHNIDITSGLTIVSPCTMNLSQSSVARGLSLPPGASAYVASSEISATVAGPGSGGGFDLADGASIEVVDSYISCRAVEGAGAFLHPGSSAVFRRCRFENNTAYPDYRGGFNPDPFTAARGTALFVDGADLLAEDCVFYNNNSPQNITHPSLADPFTLTGAECFLIRGTCVVDFTRCAFVENDAGGRDFNIGGDVTDAPEVTFTNCTFADDSLEIGSDTLAIMRHCTHSGTGGEIIATDTARLEVEACAFGDGAPSKFAAGPEIVSLGYNFSSSDVTGSLTSPSDQVVALRLGSLGERDGTFYFLPLSGSPLIDALPAPGSVPTDQRGRTRPIDGDGDGTADVDIGAIEVETSIVVTTSSNNPAAGVTLEEAVGSSLAGGVITFDPDLAGDIFTPDASNLMIDKQLTIDAAGLDEPIYVQVINGNITVATSMRLTLFNVRFRANSSPILLQAGASLVATDCNFSSHSAGAITNPGGGQLTLTRCLFRDNSKDGDGGAISVGLDSTIILADCTFSGNSANSGGAIHAGSLHWLECDRCLFEGNRVDAGLNASYGAAVYAPVGTYYTSFRNCTFTGNEATYGSAYFGTPAGARLEFLHCTITQNYTGRFGSTIQDSAAVHVDSENPESVEFSHTILARNVGVNRETNNYLGPAITDLGYNLEDQATVGFTAPTCFQNCDPLLAPLANYGGDRRSMAPYADSPVIDAGDPSILPAPGERDQRGLVRLVNGNGDSAAPRIDIGAQEAGAPSFASNLDNASPGSLRSAIAAAADGDRVILRRVLNAATIELSSQLMIDRDVMIDATRLPMGITLFGGGTHRVAKISPEVKASFHAVEFSGGSSSGDGGALLVEGELFLSRCTIAENTSTGSGGGIFVSGGALRCDNVTIANNTSSQGGAAISDNPALRSQMSFNFCTIRDNAADTGTGGLRLGNSAVDFRFSYVGNNTSAGTLNNLRTQPASSVNSLDFNLEYNNQLGFSEPNDTQFLPVDAQPQALADNGGHVRTCASSGPTPSVVGFYRSRHFTYYDARGFSRSVEYIVSYDQLNAGAHQYASRLGDLDSDGLPDYWENQNRTELDTPDADADPDSDGMSNLDEFRALTKPHDPESVLRITNHGLIAADEFRVQWQSLGGLTYLLQESVDLSTWSTAASVPGKIGSPTTTGLAAFPVASPHRFYRVRVAP